MLLVLKENITQEQKELLKRTLTDQNCITREIRDMGKDVIGVIGKITKDIDYFKKMDGIADVVPISTPFKFVSREFKKEDTKVKVGDVVVGGDRIVIMAGPCAVETLEQCMSIAKSVRQYGGVLFRGGAYKPRSSPYSFQGLEEEGLKILAKVREETGLGVVTEMTSPVQADLMMQYVDVVQIGARNMQNFELLKCVGKMGKPVLLKRGLASTIQEWLMSAEYIVSEGNENVILCERGIRTFEPSTRNTLDLSAIPVLKKLTHLPIIIDPSHATGMREKVSPMARAAIAAGADGLMIEVHNDPDNALSDGPQSLYPEQFGKLTRDLYVIAPVVGKQLDFDYLKKSETMKKSNGNGAGTATFIGALGTYSHIASMQYFGDDIKPLPKETFRDIFKAVDSGDAEYGVIPLENSLSGSIHENYDLLQEYDLKIIGEIKIRIEHSLIAQKGATKESITKVLSPPPALSQCKHYLDQHPDYEQIIAKATASAVKTVSESDDLTLAAIGSSMAADIFKMTIIDKGIEDNPRNYTRFAIISKNPETPAKGTKSSIIFSTINKPGALFGVMKVFSDHEINLVKLESRPIAGKPWKYMFYADLETNIEDDKSKQVVKVIEEKTDYYRVLGVY
ncbi:MAG: 3-deoxy-7-phosphoheptulonate synthase [Desulfobacterales bacterium]|nr:3-deoxy-7-phosphoheptulonate synthase [Desulfobacterales bacterium]